MEFPSQLMSFHALLPEVAETETRSVTVIDDRLGLEPGRYVFDELYCTDKKCDCRRAMIRVSDDHGNLCATLSYGWESLQFYIKWMYGDRDIAEDIPGINFYSMQPQGQYAAEFLEMFRNMMEEPAYEERIRRHYTQFKETVIGKKANVRKVVNLDEQRKRRRRLKKLARKPTSK